MHRRTMGRHYEAANLLIEKMWYKKPAAIEHKTKKYNWKIENIPVGIVIQRW